MFVHMDQMEDLLKKLSAELRSGFKPAYENFVGFFHVIDWKEPWLICLVSFHALFLLVAFTSWNNINLQMSLFLLARVYLTERLNSFLAGNWTSFAGRNYFDTQGLFLSVLWSGPLLVIAILIFLGYIAGLFLVSQFLSYAFYLQVNISFSLCHLIVRSQTSCESSYH